MDKKFHMTNSSFPKLICMVNTWNCRIVQRVPTPSHYTSLSEGYNWDVRYRWGHWALPVSHTGKHEGGGGRHFGSHRKGVSKLSCPCLSSSELLGIIPSQPYQHITAVMTALQTRSLKWLRMPFSPHMCFIEGCFIPDDCSAEFCSLVS